MAPLQSNAGMIFSAVQNFILTVIDSHKTETNSHQFSHQMHFRSDSMHWRPEFFWGEHSDSYCYYGEARG